VTLAVSPAALECSSSLGGSGETDDAVEVFTDHFGLDEANYSRGIRQQEGHRAHCPGGMLRALDALRYSRIPA
jgi:hypothetical protein